MILEAADVVNKAIGAEVGVSIGICGLFSVMIELLGYEEAVEALCNDDKKMQRLIDFAGTGVIPYDTPPWHVHKVKEMLEETYKRVPKKIFILP